MESDFLQYQILKKQRTHTYIHKHHFLLPYIKRKKKENMQHSVNKLMSLLFAFFPSYRQFNKFISVITIRFLVLVALSFDHHHTTCIDKCVICTISMLRKIPCFSCWTRARAHNFLIVERDVNTNTHNTQHTYIYNFSWDALKKWNQEIIFIHCAYFTCAEIFIYSTRRYKLEISSCTVMTS